MYFLEQDNKIYIEFQMQSNMFKYIICKYTLSEIFLELYDLFIKFNKIIII